MGDRTHCTLMIGGEIAETALAPLIAALTETVPNEFVGDSIEDALCNDGRFEFWEVNGGAIPEALEQALIAAGVAFRWSWADGADYGPGAELHDPATGERGEYGTLDGELAIRVADAENPDVLRHAERWLTFERDFPELDVVTDKTADAEAKA